MVIEYDPRLPGVHEDPYPHYAQLRAAAPVHWSTVAQAWVLTRYADVVAVLRDQRFSAAARLPLALAALSAQGRQQLAALTRTMTLVLAYLDPPAHTRLRRLVNAAFRPGMVEALRPQIQALVDGLLEPLQAGGQLDVVTEFAYPLAVMVSAELLGLPARDHPRLIAWAEDFWALTALNELGSPVARERAEQTIISMTRYFQAQLAARRTRRTDDVISAFLAANESGEAFSEDEAVAACIMTVFAGHLNIRYLIGVGLLTLLQHPNELARLRADPTLIGAVVDELVRYDGVAQILIRVALEEIELGGRLIHRGDRVLIMLAAANRDPEQFACPDRFDPQRTEPAGIPFGIGHHFCPGVSLSKAIAEIAFTALIQRLPGLQLRDQRPAWAEFVQARGLNSLPVTFTSGAP